MLLPTALRPPAAYTNARTCFPIVRFWPQVKMGRCAYQYVEVMACPSGCLNGGGQVKPGPGVSPQQLLEQLEQAYTHQVG